jgi:hypothetical protein
MHDSGVRGSAWPNKALQPTAVLREMANGAMRHP